MVSTVDPITLGEIALFQGLASADLSRLGVLLHTRTFPARASIMTADQPGEVAYILIKGTVKIHLEQPDGTDVILAILGRGEVIGEMSLADNLTRSATVVTQEESTLLWIGRADFWECLRTMPTVGFNLTRILSRRLRLANAQIQALASLDVYGRVAHQILALAQEYGQTAGNGDIVIQLRLTQDDLAGLIGASRVRVNQALGSFKRHNYLSADENHRFTVHDRTALAHRCK